jgi:hypothetical protein
MRSARGLFAVVLVALALTTSGIITPFMFLYALHDALVKPLPGTLVAPSLAEDLKLKTR